MARARLKTRFAASVKDFGGAARAAVEATMKRAATEAFERIWDRTPVDTGYARSRWQMVKTSAGLGYVISNDAPYIVRLEYGYSQQAPQGMVRITGAEWPEIVAWAARKERLGR
jgi:hypothetical protein